VNNRDTLTDEQKQLFKDFGTSFLAHSHTDEVLIRLQRLDDTRQLTVEARIGDQGSYLLTAARAKLGPKGITVRTKSMGKKTTRILSVGQKLMYILFSRYQSRKYFRCRALFFVFSFMLHDDSNCAKTKHYFSLFG
jgi:hypothetical protein